jgi:mannosyltransferase OCH1-like enzyme
MSNIPKIAHISWIDKNVVHSQSPIILNGLKNLIDMNPHWDIHIYNNDEIEEYLKGVLGIDYQLIKHLHIVPKSDLWRLFKMYYEGGLYMDIDRFYNIPMDEVIPQDIDWVLPINADFDFSHDLMLSAEGNPVFAECINLYLSRRKEGIDNVYYLGPQTWMHSITKTLCGEIIDVHPSKEVFDKIKNEISKTPFIKVVREELPYNSLVYNYDFKNFKMGNESTMDWETLKRKFYREYNMSHWTGEF